jgi:HD domain
MSTARRWWPLAGLVMVPVVFLVVLRSNESLDLQWFSAYGHLVVVSAIATCALVVAIVASITAIRCGKSGVVWLGLGCSIVGVAMLAHGLTTPGVFGRTRNVWVGRFPYVAMAGLAFGLLASSTSPTRWLNRFVAARPGTTLAVPLSLLVGLVVAIVVDSTWLWGSASVAHEEVFLDGVSLACAAVLLPVIVVHWHRWHLGHDVVQLAIVFAAGMCVAALTALEHGVFGRLSWWDYHAYLLAGFGCAAFAVLKRGRREKAVSDVLAMTFEDDPFDVISSGYPEALTSMVRAVEIKDAYTHGHSDRTARLAVELGHRMNLAPNRLRVIARGAYLHDLGKIGIPDHILNKPGALTPDERAVIETHPQLGYDIASAAHSLREALPVILHHHERLDGEGYPAGLSGSSVPLEARVVTVADVWDALTSRRAYRDPMTPSDALAHIVAGSGSHFDPVVVDALLALLADQGVSAARVGEAETAWKAAQTCHEIDRESDDALAPA